jgi:hypothetical protein
MRLFLAIRAFWVVLFHGTVAARVKGVLDQPALPAPEAAKIASAQTVRIERPKPPIRSDAVTLLATLQREARFVDLVQESLDGYTDAQVGAAARDVLRDCRKVLERLFALKPVLGQDEGAAAEVPAGFDAGRFRLTGNVAGEGPFRGRLVHPGWEAARCELPAWSGSEASARVVAPAEVEL